MDKVSRARELGRDGSRAEKICWQLIRDRRINGVKFRRQHPIGPYFADFACLSRKLVIEIDGDHHAFQVEADTRRTAAMGRPQWNGKAGVSCVSGRTKSSRIPRAFGQRLKSR
jgi:very-short-patch-repair endonuclease